MKNIVLFTCLSLILIAFNGCIKDESNCLKVSYSLNSSDAEGNAPEDSRRYAENSLVTVLGTDATRPNHTFTGWNTKADGTGTPFLPGDTFRIKTDVKLYAQWSNVELFIVTFDPNGGTGGSSDEVNVNSILKVKTMEDANVERTGFTFSSWNTMADGSGTTYLPGEEFEVISNITFYAQWAEVPSFTVAYDPNGGTGGSSDQINENSVYTIKTAEEAEVERTGFIFTSWNAEANGSGTSYQPGQTITVSGNITLYAQWETLPEVQVTYNANGGEGGPHTDDVITGTSYTIKSDVTVGISRLGFTFTGWNTMANGLGTSYQPGQTITMSGNLALYAQWTEIPSFTVAYDANGGLGGSSEQVSENSTYTIKTDVEVGVERTGFTFIAWNTAQDGSGITYQPGNIITVTGNIVLFAQWEAIPEVRVTYDANEGTGGHTEDIIPGSQYRVKSNTEVGISRTGYTFIEWNTQADGSGTTYQSGNIITVTGNIVLFAQWEAIPVVQVTYNANGGDGGLHTDDVITGTSYTIKSDATVGMSRTNYIFDGWNTMPDGSGISYQPGQTITVSGNLTLYAQWRFVGAIYYNVYYIANFGTGSYSEINITLGTIYTVRAPSEIGISHILFTFKSWNTRSDGLGTSYQPGDTIIINSDVILYAQWGF